MTKAGTVELFSYRDLGSLGRSAQLGFLDLVC